MNTYRLIFPLLFVLFLLNSFVVFSGIPYEVVMVRGKVEYSGQELKRGDRLQLPDLDVAANMQSEIKNIEFGSSADVLHLLDLGRRKIVVVPAQAVRPGRDLMLATRGIKYIRSDFEFQRAFTPGESVIALLSEDTLICRGLQKYRFTGDEVLVASFEYQGQEFSNIIGRNDTLFLTRNNLFGIENGEGRRQINSFEVSNISLVWVNSESLEFAARQLDIKPFSLYFLDDMINYFVAVRYDGIGMDRDAIYNMLVPNFVTERQIQREYNLLTAEEARQWLFEKIDTALAAQ
jgi:hypothetical protein